MKGEDGDDLREDGEERREDGDERREGGSVLRSIAMRGEPLATARAALILVHGRGATAESMMPLVEAIGGPGLAYLAPQAPGSAWYPYSFLAPIAQNEPQLSNALAILDELVTALAENHLPPERVALVGFSQGACLALEYAARHPRRYGAVIGFSGGLIGPPGAARQAAGSFEGALGVPVSGSLGDPFHQTPVFLGCSDADPHIPEARVWETAQVLERLGAQVTTRIYPRMGHTVNADELVAAREMIAGMIELS